MTAKEKARLRIRIRKASDINSLLNDAQEALIQALSCRDELEKLCPGIYFSSVASEVDTAMHSIANAQASIQLKITRIREVYGAISNS